MSSGRTGGLNKDLNYCELFMWAELKAQAQRPDYGTYWIDELKAAIAVAIGKNNPPGLTSTFRGVGSGRIYRPVLYREDRINGVPRCFFAAFNEQIEPELVGVLGDCGLAFNVLRIGTRFRSEVVDPFCNRLARAEGPEEVRTRCRELIESIRAIEDESQRHGQLGHDRFIELLSIANRPEVGQMLQEWRTIRQALCDEREAESPNVSMMLEARQRLQAMNIRFMSLLSLRYHELLTVEGQGAGPTARYATTSSTSGSSLRM